MVGSALFAKARPPKLEAQEEYFSYRVILVAIVSQNDFVLLFMGYLTIIVRHIASGVSHRCACAKTKYQEGITPVLVTANLPERYRATRGIAAIVSQYRAIWGH